MFYVNGIGEESRTTCKKQKHFVVYYILNYSYKPFLIEYKLFIIFENIIIWKMFLIQKKAVHFFIVNFLIK